MFSFANCLIEVFMTNVILTHANLSSESVELNKDSNKVTLPGTSRFQIFNLQFKSWEPDHLHWVAPSNIIIYDNGDWFIFISHLANMRRTGGPLDTGNYQSWCVNVSYLDKNKSVLHSKDYPVCGLQYKQYKDNLGVSGNDPSVPGILSNLNSGLFTRRVS
ncbi:MAG: hypothetical protein CITR_04085 [Citrobacter freundii]